MGEGLSKARSCIFGSWNSLWPACAVICWPFIDENCLSLLIWVVNEMRPNMLSASKWSNLANFAQFFFKVKIHPVNCLLLCFYSIATGFVFLTYQLCEFWAPDVFFFVFFFKHSYPHQILKHAIFVQVWRAQASHVSVWLITCVSLCLCYLSCCVLCVCVCVYGCVYLCTHVFVSAPCGPPHPPLLPTDPAIRTVTPFISPWSASHLSDVSLTAPPPSRPSRLI